MHLLNNHIKQQIMEKDYSRLNIEDIKLYLLKFHMVIKIESVFTKAQKETHQNFIWIILMDKIQYHILLSQGKKLLTSSSTTEKSIPCLKKFRRVRRSSLTATWDQFSSISSAHIPPSDLIASIWISVLAFSSSSWFINSLCLGVTEMGISSGGRSYSAVKFHVRFRVDLFVWNNLWGQSPGNHFFFKIPNLHLLRCQGYIVENFWKPLIMHAWTDMMVAKTFM